MLFYDPKRFWIVMGILTAAVVAGILVSQWGVS